MSHLLARTAQSSYIQGYGTPTQKVHMVQSKLQQTLMAFVDSAVELVASTEGESILVRLDFVADWAELERATRKAGLLVASHLSEVAESAMAYGMRTILLEMPEATIQDRLSQAILESVAAEWISTGATVVAVYSRFEVEKPDTVSVIHLNERLGKLTARDLRQLETKVPLDTLKLVVDLAVDIGREGREGKPVGTMLIVGDHRHVLQQSRPACFDLVKGYPRRERNLADPWVRECMKEIAQLDGAIIIASDGTVEATSRLINTGGGDLMLTTGLGARHYAGAAISKNTQAISVVVSESSGTVRLFQNGEVVLRIEPFRRAMKWKDHEGEMHYSGEA